MYKQFPELSVDPIVPFAARASPGDDYRVDYDLERRPASYDFLNWMINAEIQRRKDGGGKLKVRFLLGPWDGFKRDEFPQSLEVRKALFECVMRPALKLLDAEETDEPSNAPSPSHAPKWIVQAVRAGHDLPQWRIPEEPLIEAREWLGGRHPVVITLREAEYYPERNSNVDAWLQFARTLDDVIFVRDTAKADEPLEFETCPRASKDLLFRAAIMSLAKANLMVSNGPMALALYMKVPWLQFKPIPRTDLLYGNWWLNRSDFWRTFVGFDIGEQYSWCDDQHRIVWEDDTLENIQAEWAKLNQSISSPDRLQKIELTGAVNTSDDVIIAQVSENIRRGLPQAKPHQPNINTCALVCGGPSLAETERELVDVVWRGAKVVAVNGAYQWCIDRNIKPSAMVMLDAREFNARFVETLVPKCRYLLASQCHPKAFEICRDREVFIWHACSGGDRELDLLNEYYFGQLGEKFADIPANKRNPFQTFFPVTLGTTVSIHAISLMRMLGFSSFEVFGLDSCWLGDQHHAYDQPENEEKRIKVVLRPRDRSDKESTFWCAPWMMKQMEDFQKLIRERGNDFRLNVHGPGLIATLLRTAAQIVIEEEEKNVASL